MEEKRREAKAAVDLMKAAYDRIRREEENRNGLIILNALYGKEADIVAKNDSTENQEIEVIDVVIPLQCLVKNSQLTLHDSPKVNIDFFLEVSLCWRLFIDIIVDFINYRVSYPVFMTRV